MVDDLARDVQHKRGVGEVLPAFLALTDGLLQRPFVQALDALEPEVVGVVELCQRSSGSGGVLPRQVVGGRAAEIVLTDEARGAVAADAVRLVLRARR